MENFLIANSELSLVKVRMVSTVALRNGEALSPFWFQNSSENVSKKSSR